MKPVIPEVTVVSEGDWHYRTTESGDIVSYWEFELEDWAAWASNPDHVIALVQGPDGRFALYATPLQKEPVPA